MGLKIGCCLRLSLVPPPFLPLADGTIGMLNLLAVSRSTLLLLLLPGLWPGLLTPPWAPLPGTRGMPPLDTSLLPPGLPLLPLLMVEDDPPDCPPPPTEDGDLVVDLAWFSQFLRKLLTHCRTCKRIKVFLHKNNPPLIFCHLLWSLGGAAAWSPGADVSLLCCCGGGCFITL